MIPVKVTCELAGAAADYAPALDALLIELASKRQRVPVWRLPNRYTPAPDPYDVPAIPLARSEMGGWPIYHVSAPIMSECPARVAHFGKRIGVEKALMLAPSERKVVTTSNTWTKSYRLPVKVLSAASIVWFAMTPDADALRDLLGDCQHIGRKVSHGWGRVKAWHVELCQDDWSWYAPDDLGRPVLMRALPLGLWLPDNLDGWRSDYGACCPPYWHVDRKCEIVAPC